MYSNVQYQAYQPTSYPFDPALEHAPSQYPPSILQSTPRPELRFQQSTPYRPSPNSEVAPPYSEVAFQPQTQRNEQQYSSRPTREYPLDLYESPRFAAFYPTEKYEDFPQTNPFTTTKQTAQHNTLSNDFNDLRIQGDRYNAECSSCAPRNHSRSSPLAAPSDYREPEYFQQRPQIPAQMTSSIASNDSDTPSEQQILHQALSFAQASPPPSNSIPSLSCPIAIPQTMPGGGQAFARAWAPSISSHGITQTGFLAFIDGLNIVSTANPPLQVLNLAGGIIGMVPHHWAAIAGFAIQTSAQLGTAAVSKGRTEMYLKEANEKFFAPRKLKVTIASRDAVGAVVGLPRGSPILAPLTREAMHMGLVERSLEVMRGYSADLDFDVPPLAEQTTILAKMSAQQIERQGKKNDKRMLKEREKALEKEEKERAKISEKQEKDRGKPRRHSDSDSGSEEESKPKSRRELKREKSRERKERRTERRAEKEAEKKRGKKGKDKEAKEARKLLWILIENV